MNAIGHLQQPFQNFENPFEAQRLPGYCFLIPDPNMFLRADMKPLTLTCGKGLSIG